VNRSTPPSSDVLTDVQAIAAGEYHTCALTQTGGVRCWGDNQYGQLGDGSTVNSSTPPSSDVLTGVQAIATGEINTCALMQTGGIRCWGYNFDLSPPTNDALTGVKAIAAGFNHTCALMQTGGVRCWGDDVYGQLGDGGLFRTSPVQVVGTCD